MPRAPHHRVIPSYYPTPPIFLSSKSYLIPPPHRATLIYSFSFSRLLNLAPLRVLFWSIESPERQMRLPISFLQALETARLPLLAARYVLSRSPLRHPQTTLALAGGWLSPGRGEDWSRQRPSVWMTFSSSRRHTSKMDPPACHKNGRASRRTKRLSKTWTRPTSTA